MQFSLKYLFGVLAAVAVWLACFRLWLKGHGYWWLVVAMLGFLVGMAYCIYLSDRMPESPTGEYFRWLLLVLAFACIVAIIVFVPLVVSGS